MNTEILTTLEFNKIIERIKEFALSDDTKNLIGKITPSTDFQRISDLLNETTEAKAILNHSNSVPLLGLNGTLMLIDRVNKDIVLQPDELDKIKHLLINTKKFKRFMVVESLLAPTISQYANSMFELPEIKEEIDRCIYNCRVDDKASPILAKVRKQTYVIEGRIKSKLDSLTKSSSIKKYLQDSTISVKNGRYVLQVKAAYKHEIPGVVVDISSTGSTLFIEPNSIGRYQEELSQLILQEENEIYQILSYLSALIREKSQELLITIETFIHYDFIFAKGKYSRAIDGHPVQLNTNQTITILQGKHPLLGTEAVPLDFHIGTDYQALIITGPNTGGKTVTLKTVGLLTLMIQSGIHIPANPSSNFGIYGSILADIGDGQNIEQSLSTFSSHVKKIIDITKAANKYTLVLLDEIGSGTDPTEGEGLAIAILDTLYDKNCTIIATSHYGKVKEYATHKKGFINGKMHFNIETLKPTYKLSIGEAGESNAFVIALRLGMDPLILNKAHNITYNEIKDYSELLFPQSFQNHQKAPITLPPYIKAKKPKKMDSVPVDTIKPNIEANHIFEIGDQVFVPSLNSKAIVFEKENNKLEVGILINNKKVFIHKRKLKLFIASKDLYPEDYDFDIVFKSKEFRKNNNLLNRKYVKDYSYEIKPEDL